MLRKRKHSVGASILSNEYKLTIDDIRKRIFGEANADEPNSQFLIMLSFSIMLMSAVDCLLTRSAAYATVFILSATIYFNTRKRYKQYDFMNKPWFTTLLSYATTTLLLFAGNSFSGNLQKYYFLSMISTLLISENIVQFVTSAILYALFSSILQFGILEGISLFCIVVPAIIPLSMTYFDLREELDQSDVSIDYYKGLSLLSSEALIIHKDGNVLNVNSAFLTLFGYEGDKDKIIHTDVSKFFTSETPYQYLNAEVDSAPDLSNEDEASPKRIIFECIGKRKDNSIIPLEIIGTVQDFLGQKVVVLGIRDICSRQAKETVLEDQEEQSAKSRFLTIVSHELKTPLNAINLLGEMIQDDDNLSEEMREHAGIIRKSTKHLLGVIKDILDFSKLETGTLTLVPDVFDLPQAVEDVMDIIGITSFEKGFEAAVYIPKTMPRRLIGDSGRFQQILSNMVANAIKFTEKGEVVINIKIEEETDKYAEILVSVRDSGIGIAKEDQHKLFKMFSQVDTSPSRRYEGTGLGLAICKELATLMHGSVGVTSEKDKGSEFWFKVRFNKPISDTQVLEEFAEALAMTNNNTYSRRTSIVDILGHDQLDEIPRGRDNEAVAFYGKEQLSTYRFGSQSAADSDESPSVDTPSSTDGNMELLEQNPQIFERRRSRNFVFVETQGGQDKVIYKKGRRSSVVDVDTKHPTPREKSPPSSAMSSPRPGIERASSIVESSTPLRQSFGSPPTAHSRGASMSSNQMNPVWRILLIYRNKAISNIAYRYLSSFGANVVTACEVQDVITNANVYFNKPLDAVAIDELCLPIDGGHSLVRAIRKMAAVTNKQNHHAPITPLMVMFMFAKNNIEEDTLEEFKVFIRKPLYLSPFEKLFYNDLAVLRQYPQAQDDDDNEDLDLRTAIKPLEMLTLLNKHMTTNQLPHQTIQPSSPTSPSVNRKKSGERIFVSFEIRPMKRASFSESARRSSYPLVHSENELNAQVVQKNDQNFLGPVVSFGSRRQSLAPELFSNNDEQKKLTVRRFLSFRDIAKSQSPLESVVNPNESEPPRLLMAEDQIINQKITKKILETFGVSVDIAQNGVDALRMMSIEEEEKTQLGSDPYTYSVSKVKNNDNMRRGDDINTIDSDAVLTPGGSGRTTLFDYDLIIMDGNMPVMDGIEATRRIRRFENRYFRTNSARHNKPIPIIGLTASSEETYQAMCIDAGMDEVITKPVNKKDLEYMLMRYLPENPTYGSYSTVKDFSFGST